LHPSARGLATNAVPIPPAAPVTIAVFQASPDRLTCFSIVNRVFQRGFELAGTNWLAAMNRRFPNTPIEHDVAQLRG